MNLAEIRKKAVEARKPELVQAPAEPSSFEAEAVDFAADDAMVDFDASEFPQDEYLADTDLETGAREELSAFDLGEGAYESPRTRDLIPGHPPSIMDEADEMPLEMKVEPLLESKPAAVELAAHVEAVPEAAAAVRHPAYDPLSTLLAGRQAAAGEGESPMDDGQVNVSADVEEYLCFKVADEEYALSIMDIKEIIKPREVTEVPRMPRFVSGVVSLRGVIIPIMDMRLRLSLPVGEPTGRERILVLRTSVGYCGVLVDEVIQVVRIKQSAIEGPPTILDGIDREFVMGLGRFDSRMLILLNLDSILNLEIH